MSTQHIVHKIIEPGLPGDGFTAPDAAIVRTKIDKGDKQTTLKSAYYEPAADGVTDDRAALQQLLDDGAGGTVTIAKGNYAIVGPLTVADSTEVIIQPGTVIEQKTKYVPVFDILHADDVTIRGNGALLTWTGSRTYTGGGSFRGNDNYAYGAGVYVAGSRVRLLDLRVHGFTCGVNLTGYNGTSLADYYDWDNEIHGLVVDNVDFGVLAGGQVNPVIKNVRGSYNLQTGSGNPPHLLYVTNSGRNRNIDIDGIRARNGVGGHAFQFKGVDGGKAVNLVSYNCEGLTSVTESNDLEVDASAISDLGQGGLGTVYLFGPVSRCKINAHIAAANATTGHRALSLDNDVSDTRVAISGRTNQTTNSEDYTAIIRGTRNALTYDIDNMDNSGNVRTVGRLGVQVLSGAGHTVDIRRARGVGRAIAVETGATSCTVNLNASAIELRSGAVDACYLPEPTVTLNRNLRLDATISGAGQTIRADPSRYSTVYVKVNTTDNFTIGPNYGLSNIPRGLRLTYIISNTSGGSMGTISWIAHTFSSTWTNPANAQEKSIEFVWDGVRWKEIGRTG